MNIVRIRIGVHLTLSPAQSKEYECSDQVCITIWRDDRLGAKPCEQKSSINLSLYSSHSICIVASNDWTLDTFL